MATIKYLYRSKKKTASISIRFSHKNEFDYILNTGLISQKEIWFDSKNIQLSYPKLKGNESIELKTTLVKLENTILNKFNEENNNNSIIDKEWLQDKIDVFFNRKKNKENELPIYLNEYIDYYISKSSILRNSKGGYGISISRINDFKRLKGLINEFSKNKKIKIIEIDLEFKERFINWMVFERNYANGYAGRMVGSIKTICNNAQINGIETNKQLSKVSGYKIENEYILYFTSDELEKIKNVVLILKMHKNARKWLLLGCYIGQRASDLLDIDSNNFFIRNGMEVIELKQKKTAKKITIPVLNETRYLLNEGLPHKISLQNFNLYIKEICRIAEIKTITRGIKYNNFIKRNEIGDFEKWELVTSHICRRTFCSINFGIIPNYLIMSVTGHTNEKTFLGYVGKGTYDYAQQFKDFFEKKR